MDVNEKMKKKYSYSIIIDLSMFITDVSQGDEMIEEAVKLRSHANHDEVAMKQLEETITILLEHFKNEVIMK